MAYWKNQSILTFTYSVFQSCEENSKIRFSAQKNFTICRTLGGAKTSTWVVVAMFCNYVSTCFLRCEKSLMLVAQSPKNDCLTAHTSGDEVRKQLFTSDGTLSVTNLALLWSLQNYCTQGFKGFRFEFWSFGSIDTFKVFWSMTRAHSVSKLPKTSHFDNSAKGIQ